MALIVFEGFDHYASIADLQSRVGALQWNDVLASTVTFVAGRGGYGYAIQLTASAGGFNLGGSFNSNLGSGIAAVAAIVTVCPNAACVLDYVIMDYTSNLPQLTFRCLLDSGTVLVYLGDVTGTLINSSPPNGFNPFVWQKYEIEAIIGPSGSYDFHVGGNSVVSGSGVNTQATANAWFNGLRIHGGVTLGTLGPTVEFDDFNLNDLTTGPGTYPVNSFIGDCATRTLYASGNSSVQWTPLASTNYVEVGEIQFDGDASYNYASTVGNTDLFTFTDLPTTVSAVFGVQLTGAYRKLDASNQTIVQVFDSGGTMLSGSAWNLSLNYTYLTDLSVLDPNTSATWTPTAVNALIGGYKLNS